MKQDNITVIIALLSVSILFATLFTLPRIDMAQPDPYFHIKVTPTVYWIGFSLSLMILIACSVLSLRHRISKSFTILGFLALLSLAVYIYVIPRLMYVNMIYTDTYLFVGESLSVLRSGHTGFGYSTETPALSCLIAQFSLVTGINYIVIAQFLPLVLPFLFLLYFYMVGQLLVGKSGFLLACLAFIALMWYWFMFNRQSLALVIELFVWYCILKVLLAKKTNLSQILVFAFSYVALVLSHPASSFLPILNTFSIIVFILAIGFIQRRRSREFTQDYIDNRKLLLKAFPIAVFSFSVWLAWQIYVGGTAFMAFRNLFTTFYELVENPSPFTHVAGIIYNYTPQYLSIVRFRLFEALFVAIAGILISFVLVFIRAKPKNIILSAWVSSIVCTNILVLYLAGWIDRPYIYSLPAFSLILVAFLELPGFGMRHKLARATMKTCKIALFTTIILSASVLPVVMYAHTPFSFPPTSYLNELDFITKKGNSSVIIFGSGAEFNYYLFLNNGSIRHIDETQIYDPDYKTQMSKVMASEAIATSFRLYTKEAFSTQLFTTQTVQEIENSLLKNPSFGKIYDADSWQKAYFRQAYFNYSQIAK